VNIRERIAAAEAQVREPASLEQREAGTYQKGHFFWNGLGITLESAKGMERKGKDRNGKAWSIKLKNSYGYIKGTRSAEPGDQMDVFVGDDPEIALIYVVDQNRNDTGVFDEHKCIIGCANSTDAKNVYLSNYSPGWKGFRAVTALTVPQFRSWLEHGDMTKPLKGQDYSRFLKRASMDLPIPQLSHKKKKEVRRRLADAIPWLIGGTAAAGGVSELVRRGALGDDVLYMLNNFSRKSELDRTFQPHANLPEADQAVHRIADYAVQGNQLLKHRFWGLITPTAVIKAIRSQPWLKESDKWTEGSGAHYDAFEAGPLSGTLRVMGELSQGGWNPVDGGPALPKLNDSIRQALRASVNSLAGRPVAEAVGGKPDTAWNFPAMSDNAISTSDQLRIMRSLPDELKKRLSKEDWEAFGANLSKGRDIVYHSYRQITDPLLALDGKWRNLNAGLLGASLLGAAGYGVHKWLAPKSKKRDDEQSKTASALLRVLRQGAKVPHGQPFAPTISTGAKRVLKLGFNPEMGVTGNRVKRLMQGAGLLGLAQGALQAGDKVSDVAGQAAGVIPEGTKLQPAKSWLEEWRDHPWITGARTLWSGIPKEISPAQRQLLGSVGELVVRAKAHDVKLPSSKDMLSHFYSPASPPTQSALHRLLGMFIDPPGAKVYNNVARDAFNVIRE
jgi:hypothetical protein